MGFFREEVGPYEKIFSQWTYAAEAENVVVGYLTGCPDSRGFTKAKLWRFALPLLVDICRGHYSENRDVQQHYNQGIRLYREEKLEPAIAEWPTVLQHDPNHEGHGPQCRKQQSILFH